MDNKNIEFLLTSSQSTQQFSACLWDYDTKNVQKLYKNGGTIAPKTLSLIGQDFLLGAELNKPILHVWLLNSSEQTHNIRWILPEPASCLTVCPRNAYLAVGIGRKLYVWQVCSGKLLSVQQRNYQPITCIKFSSDGTFLAVTGQDGILVVYSLADLVSLHTNMLIQSEIGQVEPLYTRSDHSMPIIDLHIGSFGRKSRLVTVSVDQTCRIYELSSGEPLLSLVLDEPLTSVVIDGPCWNLFTGTNSGVVNQFSLKNPPRTLIHHVDEKSKLQFLGHKKKVTCLAINGDGNILATGSEDNYVFTWDIRSRQILQKFEHKSSITNIKFIPNFKNIFAESIKLGTVLKNLERSVDATEDFSVSIVQNFDLEISDEESSLQNSYKINGLVNENRTLKVTNGQLYKAALNIRKRK